MDYQYQNNKPKCRKCNGPMNFVGGYDRGRERLDLLYTHEVYRCPYCRTCKVVKNQWAKSGIYPGE